MIKKQKTIVEIAPATNISNKKMQVFSYLASSPKVKIGDLVKITLGSRNLTGSVIDLKEKTDIKIKLKPALILKPEISLTRNQIKLAEWISDYYNCSLGLVIKMMIPKIVKVREKTTFKQIASLEPFHMLTYEQQTVYNGIKNTKKTVSLIFGITGSGKTEIYMHLIRDTILKGKQAIVLVPEIALTPQTIERFTNRFGKDKIAVFHSKMSYGEKFKQWRAVYHQKAKIVIGPRSALFAPVQNLGLIVLDEEHETSYKQWDQQPKYHARDVAIKYAQISGSKVILGSATPSIETYHSANNGNFELFTLKNRVKEKAKLPKVEIVDMREELKAKNTSVFSARLKAELKKVLERKGQAMLFMNRRGLSTFIMCRNCGFVVKCRNCDIPLTYHFSTRSLFCHYCHYKDEPPTICPECKSKAIKYFGSGTERIELETKKNFPIAKVLRMDSDTTSMVRSHEKIFNAFKKGRAQILIGTQMIAKGFDLPRVDLIGIISADTALNFPDFRSGERAFQILTQIAGRTCRINKIGKVILQTYNPDHFVIKTAASQDYDKFFRNEIKQRKELSYPPFSRIIKLTFSHKNPAKSKTGAIHLYNELLKQRNKFPINMKISEPCPAFISKLRGKYRWHIILRAKSFEKLKNFLPDNCDIDIDPIEIL